MEKKVTRIPPKSELSMDPFKHVGIYCRVSSSSKKQLHSLAAQASGLARRVATQHLWKLEDIYLDVASGSDSQRVEYRRMLEDAVKGKIDLVVVKSSSRLGRDTVEVIQACRDLAAHHCDVYFDNADEYYSRLGPLVVEITAAVDLAENESRSENISLGIRRQMESGSSKIYDRVCFGYDHDADGHLVIREDQAVVVRKIFMLYLVGNSVLKIKRALENEEIPAPRGGTTWPKRTIEAILTNAKYAGTSYARTYCIADADSGRGIVATGDKGEQYILFGAIDNNPPIIPPKTFDKVQQMRMDRSNIEYDPDGTKKRKSTHYSSKQKPAGDV